MTIYIVTAYDEDLISLRGEGQNVSILKAFDSQQKAHDFMADCGFELEQWEKSIPAEVEDDEVNSANWHKHCEIHPIAEKYGVFATTFFCHEIEVE